MVGGQVRNCSQKYLKNIALITFKVPFCVKAFMAPKILALLLLDGRISSDAHSLMKTNMFKLSNHHVGLYRA